MLKNVLAAIAVLAQILQWVKALLDKREMGKREKRNEEIRNDPAGEFIDKFGDPAKRVRDDTAGPGMSGDKAGADTEDDSRRD